MTVLVFPEGFGVDLVIMNNNKVIRFLEEYNIPYRTSGRNVKKGNLNINCIWCPHDDGFHMGIIPESGVYGCWRDRRHRGRSFAKLIKALINCSWEEANRLAGGKTTLEEGDDLLSLVDRMFEEDKQEPLGGATHLALLKEFKEIENQGTLKPYYKYLQSRGFSSITRLLNKYDILCCQYGEWKQRLIFPIYYQGSLVTWVGRSLYSGATILYKDLEIKKSVRHAKYCLWNFDSLLIGGKVLMIGEGFFDALKLDYYSPKGFRATCLLTKTMTLEQMYLLRELAPLYDELWLVLDRDAQAQAMDMASELFFFENLKVKNLPESIDDPGEMSEEDVLDFAQTN